MDMQKNLIDLLFSIRKRPPLYLSRKSIFNLGDFINGFFFGLDNEQHVEIMNEFRSFIVKKQPQLEHRNTFNILYEVANHDEVKAFDLFFVEFGSFLTELGVDFPR